jgi:hypothetical protein
VLTLVACRWRRFSPLSRSGRIGVILVETTAEKLAGPELLASIHSARSTPVIVAAYAELASASTA